MSNVRRTIQKIDPSESERGSLWISALGLTLGGVLAAGLILSRFELMHPVWYRSGWFWLGTLAATIFGIIYATRKLKRSAARRCQTAGAISLIFHALLAVILENVYLSLAADFDEGKRQPNPNAVREIVLPQLVRETETAEADIASLTQPVPVENPTPRQSETTRQQASFQTEMLGGTAESAESRPDPQKVEIAKRDLGETAPHREETKSELSRNVAAAASAFLGEKIDDSPSAQGQEVAANTAANAEAEQIKRENYAQTPSSPETNTAEATPNAQPLANNVRRTEIASQPRISADVPAPLRRQMAEPTLEPVEKEMAVASAAPSSLPVSQTPTTDATDVTRRSDASASAVANVDGPQSSAEPAAPAENVQVAKADNQTDNAPSTVASANAAAKATASDPSVTPSQIDVNAIASASNADGDESAAMTPSATTAQRGSSASGANLVASAAEAPAETTSTGALAPSRNTAAADANLSALAGSGNAPSAPKNGEAAAGGGMPADAVAMTAPGAEVSAQTSELASGIAAVGRQSTSPAPSSATFGGANAPGEMAPTQPRTATVARAGGSQGIGSPQVAQQPSAAQRSAGSATSELIEAAAESVGLGEAPTPESGAGQGQLAAGATIRKSDNATASGGTTLAGSNDLGLSSSAAVGVVTGPARSASASGDYAPSANLAASSAGRAQRAAANVPGESVQVDLADVGGPVGGGGSAESAQGDEGVSPSASGLARSVTNSGAVGILASDSASGDVANSAPNGSAEVARAASKASGEIGAATAVANAQKSLGQTGGIDAAVNAADVGAVAAAEGKSGEGESTTGALAAQGSISRAANSSGPSGGATGVGDVADAAANAAMGGALSRAEQGDQQAGFGDALSSLTAAGRQTADAVVPKVEVALTDSPGTSSGQVDNPTQGTAGNVGSPRGVQLARRSGGGLQVQSNASVGVGGLGVEAAPSAGMLSRRARDESQLVDAASGRFLRKDVGLAAAAIDARARAEAPSFASRFGSEQGEGKGPFGSEVDEAIELGLAYLARRQAPDGHWSLHDDPTTPGSRDVPPIHSDTAATGLALLAFLGAGHDHFGDKYKDNVQRGLDFLRRGQKQDGDLFQKEDNHSNKSAWLYSHAIATIALCEAYGMTADSALRDPAQRALAFIEASQNKRLGSWRYEPGEPGDTSVTGWMLMALKSGELSGLTVNKETYLRVQQWLDQATADNTGGSQFVYNPEAPDTDQQRLGRKPTPTMTSVGLLSRMYLGWNKNTPQLARGADYLQEHPPRLDSLPNGGGRDTYYWYYSTQVMFHMGGEYWQKWSVRMHSILVGTQEKSGSQAGSWNPMGAVPDRWGAHGGRVYVTAMNLLSLEVAYRHLPLYISTQE